MRAVLRIAAQARVFVFVTDARRAIASSRARLARFVARLLSGLIRAALRILIRATSRWVQLDRVGHQSRPIRSPGVARASASAFFAWSLSSKSSLSMLLI